MRVDGDWRRRPATQAVLAALTGAGHRALFVGGAVRNAILDLPVDDVDIATDAPPHAVIAAVNRAGLRAVPTGIAHGTVTVVADGLPHEVTTFRRDVETDGRHAVVAFTDDLSADAARRDFTMNALYATPEGEVVDPLGGLGDLRAGRVRFVGNPDARIAEDHLRILRFFRFHAWFGNPDTGLDADALAACAAGGGGLDTLSRERVGSEMRKLLSARDPAPAVAAMAQAGILGRVLPGADPRLLAILVSFEEGIAPNWVRRLAALGGQNVEERLRLSRSEFRDLADLRLAVGGSDSPAALGWRFGSTCAGHAVLLRAAMHKTPPPAGWQAEVARGAATALPISAADLMPELQGVALGLRLAELIQRWLASDLRLTRADLLSGA